MGHVYEAEHSTTGQRVALKVLKQALANEEKLVARFMREARAAASIAHPNAIQVSDVFREENGTPVMVMELLDGEGLDRVMARGRVPFVEIARIVVPVLEAIGEAHAKGIVHRDLKPENIFLARTRGGDIVPKVLDFGIAKVLSATGIEEMRLTSTGTMVGTPYYMAPEQLSGRADVDHRADVWSIGVVMYESISGRLPFPGDNFGQVFTNVLQTEPPELLTLVNDLAPEVSALVHRCLGKDPLDRPFAAGEIAETLAPFAGLPKPTIGAPVSIPSSMISGSYEALEVSDIRRIKPPDVSDTLPSGPILVSDVAAMERLRAQAAATPEPAGSGPVPRRPPVLLIALAAVAVIALGIAAYAVAKLADTPPAPAVAAPRPRASEPVVEASPVAERTALPAVSGTIGNDTVGAAVAADDVTATERAPGKRPRVRRDPGTGAAAGDGAGEGAQGTPPATDHPPRGIIPSLQ